jgi:hypothetical protein
VHETSEIVEETSPDEEGEWRDRRGLREFQT